MKKVAIALLFFIGAVILLSAYLPQITYNNIRDIGIYAVSHMTDLEQRVMSSEKYKKQIASHIAENASIGKTATIVFLGDSLTKSFNIEDRFPHQNVLQRGIAGDTTKGLKQRLPHSIGDLSIRKLFLLIGYNDLKYRGVDEIIGNIETVINSVSANKVYVQSILPIAPTRVWNNRRIKDLNSRLDKLCREKNVTFVNLFPAFEENGGLKPELARDTVHLNEKGYDMWFQMVRSLVDQSES